MNELATIADRTDLASRGDDILDAWLSGRNPRTLDAYRRDLADFARFLGAESPSQAVDGMLALGHGAANRLTLGYRASMVERGLSSATIARRLAAIRSMIRLARQLGRINWALDVESPKVTKYRDTSGPGLDGWRRMRARAARTTTRQGKRDLALILLMHDSCLRRGECIGLDVEHVDVERSAVSVLGKGRTDREWITISRQALAAVVAWLDVRGGQPGAVFVRLDRAAIGLERMTGDSVNRVVARIGRMAGLKRTARAHGLRHQGITRALDLTNGNLRTVQRLSRHADPRTLMAYDDNRRDDAGTLANMLGDDSDFQD